MNYHDFMQLPLESRKVIEQKILELDKAVQDTYGISMLKSDIGTIKVMNNIKHPDQLTIERNDK